MIVFRILYDFFLFLAGMIIGLFQQPTTAIIYRDFLKRETECGRAGAFIGRGAANYVWRSVARNPLLTAEPATLSAAVRQIMCGAQWRAIPC